MNTTNVETHKNIVASHGKIKLNAMEFMPKQNRTGKFKSLYLFSKFVKKNVFQAFQVALKWHQSSATVINHNFWWLLMTSMGLSLAVTFMHRRLRGKNYRKITGPGMVLLVSIWKEKKMQLRRVGAGRLPFELLYKRHSCLSSCA